MKRNVVSLMTLVVFAFAAISSASAESPLKTSAVFAGEESAFMLSVPLSGSDSNPVLKADLVGMGVAPTGVQVVPQGTTDWSCEKSIFRSDDRGGFMVTTSLRCELLNPGQVSGTHASLSVKAVWPIQSIGTEQYLFSGDESETIQVFSSGDSGLNCVKEPFDPRCYLEIDSISAAPSGEGAACWDNPNQPRCWLDPDGQFEIQGDETICLECRPNCWRDSNGVLHCRR